MEGNTAPPKVEKKAELIEEKFPVFKDWKGEEAQDMLRIMWFVSGGNKEFILTMYAENGKFTPKRKHPNQNNDGSWDYSFGLNSYYHKDMINRIVNGSATLEEIAHYHWKIWNEKDWTTSCGKKKFCGYNRIHLDKIKNAILFP